MTTIASVLMAAQSEVGYTESPKNSNCNKFAPEANLKNCTYWCAAYTSAILIRSKVHVPKGVLTLSTRANVAAWKAAGRWVEPEAVEPGDIIFYHLTNRNGTNPNVPDHTGFALVRPFKGHQPAVEGNTSASDSGSQSNGGGVFNKDRPISKVIGAGRPWYSDYDPAPNPEPPSPQEDTMFILNPVGDQDGTQFWVNGDTRVPLATDAEAQQFRNSGFIVRDMEPLALAIFKQTNKEIPHP